MSSEKTIIYSPDGAGYGSNGLDPNLWMSMMNNGGFGGGNFIWAIILLAVLRNGGILGNNDGNYNMGYISSQVAQGFSGNTNAISNLATSLNCTTGQIQQAIASIQSMIQNVGAQNNLSFAQTVNAIQAGDSNIISTLQSCCCDLKTTVNNQGYENRINNLQQSQLIQNGFSQLGYAAAEHTAAISGKIDQQTNLINDKFCQLEMREMQNKIDALRDENKTLKGVIDNRDQTAVIGSMIAPLKSDIETMKCKLPQTFNVPYQPFTAIPNCVAYGMGLYGAGYGLNNGIAG